MHTETQLPPPELHQLDEEPDTVMVSAHISDQTGATYSASIQLDAREPLSNISAALLQAATGAAATHGPVLSALFRDLVETQRALANAVPAEASGLRHGIRVADVDQLIQAHQGSNHPPRLIIPGLGAPVDAQVVRAVLVAAGAY